MKLPVPSICEISKAETVKTTFENGTIGKSNHSYNKTMNGN